MDILKEQASNEPWNSTPSSYSLVELSEWQKLQLSQMNVEAGVNCLLKMWLNYTYSSGEVGSYCNATWDNIYCWPPTPSGTEITRLCSEAFRETRYDYAVHLEGSAKRTCLENGTWSQGMKSNYNECAISLEKNVKKAEEERNLVFLVQHMLFVGSILSLLCLTISLMIFYKFRCLWCDRVKVHAHLMLALILRFILLLVITEPFVFHRSSNYRDVDFLCKAIITVYLYATVASVSWMFIQGLYLNSKLTTNVFSTNTQHHFAVYHIIGWVLPCILVLVYLIAMIIKENRRDCWKGYADMPEMWILFGPMIFALVINALFLINILRVVLEKVRSTNLHSETSQILAAAKATLILFPVLGVNNLLLLYNPGGVYEKYYVTLNTFFGATQGIFVSIVYCFNSKEVHDVIRRSYNRLITRMNLNRSHNNDHPETRNSPRTMMMMVDIHPEEEQHGHSQDSLQSAV